MNQVFILMNGYSKSGKTTLVNKILETFPKVFVSIDTTKIHDFLNHNYPIFQDDQSITGNAYDLRDKTTKAMQKTMQNTLLKEGVSYIDDSCNSKLEKRQEILSSVRSLKPNIVTMIISVQISEIELLKRLQTLDDEAESRGNKRVWVELYEKVQKPATVVPTAQEANHDKEILDKIRKVLNLSQI